MMSGTKHATLLLYKPGEVHCGMLFYCDISTSGILFYAQAKALVTDVVLLYSMFAHIVLAFVVTSMQLPGMAYL